MTRKVEDWFARAAPAVLDLGDADLTSLAIPLRGPGLNGRNEEHAALEALALLEHLRRKAVADPAREAEIERDGAGGYRALLAYYEGRDGYHPRIAALVRKRPQPRKVKPGPWLPPWQRGSTP
jgi:hypothetical protein